MAAEYQPDHPYYHLDELSERERDNFEARKTRAFEFFFYLIREDRTKRSMAVELTPSDTLATFRIFKSVKVEIAAKRIARDCGEGNERGVMFHTRHLTAYRALTLRDVWIAGLWIIDKEFYQPESSLPIDPSERARLDQLVSVVEDALKLEAADELFPPTTLPPFD